MSIRCNVFHSPGIKTYGAGFFVAWTCCVAASLALNFAHQRKEILQLARIRAELAINKDMVYRKWAASKGGVYVPASTTPSNPYLKVPGWDLSAPGHYLTLVNPAYMTRQVNEMAKEAGLDVGHITSLRPLRPENLPDAWERTALLGFEAGKKESSGLDYISGAEYFRLMRPFLVEASCLKCHASQGYRVGEIRGGISSSVPMAPLYAVEKRVRTRLSLAHGFIWLVGLAGIVFAIGRLSARVRQARSAELRADREREKSERYLAIAAEIILALDPDGKVALLNESGYRLLGHETGTLDGKDWFAACLPEASRRETADYFGKLRRGETDEMVREGPVVTNEGAVRQVLWRTVALRDGDGGFAGTLSSGTDITERRQAEEAISESEKRFRSLFENMLEGFAYCKMLYDGGVPVDFIYLEVNAAFKTLTGLKDVTGKKASHVIPGVRDSDPELFEI
ncbi:MAG TPA: DUF3365 domain-containing protein [Spirochaetota bacterium]|nr:DUF3365 domain-containing protein [Spirochaetota bacterium]HPC41135.1 DUF3365 domain-containing protein [Spirochaetota bacterium]HQF07055.1 DUF3365 domain-containing protein [Spirochaetota bacterium]HQH95792.1 DUF3365 domain-containing protein [Spirochaetota bacterium]HQJ71672.1 DUF3365 domain-containing protein [Spirochaetota bacterium]